MGTGTGGAELGRNVGTGNFTSAASGAAVGASGYFNVSVWGVFVGTVVLERSFDAGTTWLSVSEDLYGTAVAFTTPTSVTAWEPEAGVIYRCRCSAYTSGTAKWRISQ